MDSLVSTDWLAGELGAGDLAVLDASAHLPAAGRDAAAEFEAGHIPGARLLDLASLKDGGSAVPNALPTAEQFAARMGALGVSPGDRVVLYDDSAVKTSARAWFMFRLHGVRDVALLDGGIAKWKAEGRPLETGPAQVTPAEHVGGSADWSRVRGKGEMIENIRKRAEQVVDARDAARFSGETADTVHDLPGGHIPGSRNLPFGRLYEADGTFKDREALRAEFAAAGIDPAAPLVTTCGSGVTASVLLFALHLLGNDDAALYDGSWSEWGADPSTPKETGMPARG